MSYIKFREDFLERMQESGATQQELAANFGIPQSSISRFVNNKIGVFSFATMLKLWPFVYKGRSFPETGNGSAHV